MKQAILITAYKDVENLLELLRYFPGDRFSVYIHFDRKSQVDITSLKQYTGNNLKCLSRKYRVNWGGRNHLLAILHLAERALQDKENTIFHLISGQDFPVQPVSYFTSILDTTKDYIQSIPYPVSYLPKGATDWYESYNFFDVFDAKNKLKLIRRFKSIQFRLGMKRSFDGSFEQKFYGSTYWSLTRTTLQHVIAYSKNSPAFLNRMKHTFCAEELYVPTVIMNSPFSGNTEPHNLRYINWEGGGKSGSPSILDLTDYEKIKQSVYLFARKFESPVSDKLKDRLQQDLN